MTNRDDKFRSIRYGSVEWYRLIEELVTAEVAEKDVKTSPQYGQFIIYHLSTFFL